MMLDISAFRIVPTRIVSGHSVAEDACVEPWRFVVPIRQCVHS